jgi:hypothetical protein
MTVPSTSIQGNSALGQPFKPTDDQLAKMPLFKRQSVPRYLFRLYSPQSAGSTSINQVSSPACLHTDQDRHDLCHDLFELDPREAATRLNDHLRWKQHHERNCNLMSWTSSLLFALYYGIYRHRNDAGNPKLEHVRLLILDTKDISPGYFAKDIELLDVFGSMNSGLQSMRDLRNKGYYYFGEYLTQGCLPIEGHCVEAKFSQMVTLGLFKSIPELAEEGRDNKLATKVCDYRSWVLGENRQVTPMALRHSITLAQVAFGDRWTVPVSLMLLALQPREAGDHALTRVFTTLFSGKQIPNI